jgi:beta-phosphoglucomutase-like phosphatase (HAD superfamily)
MRRIEAILFEPAAFLAEDATLYEDVIPALTELKAMGIHLYLAPHAPPASLEDFFPGPWTGEKPENTIYLTDSSEGIETARSLGLSPVLIMNDPDAAMRLTAQNPAGGVVSLSELPDFIRLVAAENGRRFR